MIPINLRKEDAGAGPQKSGAIKFMCPVSQKTITNQKVVLIKSTGTFMLESAANQLAYPTMTCPLTGKSFKMEDVIELHQAASGFSASGEVQAKKYRPNIN